MIENFIIIESPIKVDFFEYYLKSIGFILLNKFPLNKGIHVALIVEYNKQLWKLMSRNNIQIEETMRFKMKKKIMPTVVHA